MKCIQCKKEAEYVVRGNSYCWLHSPEWLKDIQFKQSENTLSKEDK